MLIVDSYISYYNRCMVKIKLKNKNGIYTLFYFSMDCLLFLVYYSDLYVVVSRLIT